MLSQREKEEILKKGTNMTNHDIKKHIQNLYRESYFIKKQISF